MKPGGGVRRTHGVWLVFVDCAFIRWLRANSPSSEANYTLGVFITAHAGAWRTMFIANVLLAIRPLNDFTML